jgi:hypothetical protein
VKTARRIAPVHFRRDLEIIAYQIRRLRETQLKR